VRKFNSAIFAKHKWLSGCVERKALLGHQNPSYTQ